MKQWVAFLCCATLFFCLFAGCEKIPETLSSDTGITTTPDQHTVPDTPVLPYNKDDSLNPFTAETAVNRELWPLFFQPLVTVNEKFETETVLAQSMQVVDATHIALTLKSGLKFSDGSKVTLGDVVYSFGQAKASDAFGITLKNLSSATVKGDTITFTLASPDVFGTACLTFPIIKKDTGKSGTMPVGSGAFVMKADASIVKNPHSTDTSPFSTVQLKHFVTFDDTLDALESSTVHFIYNDLSKGNIPRTGAFTKAVPLTQLVYLGANNYKAVTCTPDFRQAVSLALDRTVIAASCYAGRADASASPFHPLWQKGGRATMWNSAQNLDGAKTAFQKALDQPFVPTPTVSTTVTGQTTATTTVTTTTTTVPADQNRIFTLIYPGGNGCREAAVSTIKKQLAMAGIAVDTVSLSFEEYTARLQAGNYDLYLGEIRLTPNMDLSSFFSPGGATAFGVNVNGEAGQTYRNFKGGAATSADFATAFQKEMPFIPLVFKQGMIAHRLGETSLSPSGYNVLDGIV